MAKKGTLVFLTLALLLVPGWLSYLYISKQESSFVDRNFRFLAFWSKELDEIVEEYKHHIEYIISTSLKNEDGLDNFKREFKKLNRKFEGELIWVSICPEFQKLEPQAIVNDQPRISAQLFSENKDLLRLTYSRKREKSRFICEDTVQVDLSISKVFPQLITHQNFFSDVIVFDSETGKIHFQENPSLYKIDDFRDVIAQRSDTGGFFSFFSNNSETTDVQGDKSSSSTPPLKDLLQNPTHRRVTIGDISYELFTQPVVLPELTLEKQTHYKQTKAVPARLILAGIVKTEKFQSEYRAIPHTWLLLFLFFVLLGLLSLPVIHLWFMDSREPLSPIHVFSLLIACVSGTALITLFFLDVVWFHNVRHSLDEQLRKTAEIIKVAFENKLEKTVNLLRAYDDSDDFEKDFAYVTEGEYFHSSDLSYHHFCAAEANLKCGGYSKEDRWVARKEYPYLCNENNKKAFPHHCDYDSVFWVDPDKNVRITWITKPEFYLQTFKCFLSAS